MEVYSIGFGKHSAGDFFETLKRAGIRQLIDVRLNNVSQLAGFTKRDDLRYFLGEIAGIAYRHELSLTPEAEMLKDYRAGQMTWQEYERAFTDLMAARRIEELFRPSDFAAPTALLCSEPTATKCHRRLVQYLKSTSIPALSAVHL